MWKIRDKKMQCDHRLYFYYTFNGTQNTDTPANQLTRRKPQQKNHPTIQEYLLI